MSPGAVPPPGDPPLGPPPAEGLADDGPPADPEVTPAAVVLPPGEPATEAEAEDPPDPEPDETAVTAGRFEWPGWSTQTPPATNRTAHTPANARSPRGARRIHRRAC